jgi:glycosyltransferase involved in cell wall biosynthesis
MSSVKRILVLTCGSFVGRLCSSLQFAAGNLEVESINLRIHGFSMDFSFFARFLAYLLQSLEAMPRLRRFDCVVSTSIMGGMILTFLRRLRRQKTTWTLIIISNGLIPLDSWLNRQLVNLTTFLLIGVSKLICFTSAEQSFWQERLGRGRAIFIPYPVNIDLYAPVSDSGDYIVAVGRVGRDFSTLIEAVRDLRVKTIIIFGVDMKGKAADWDFKRIPQNIKLYYEIPASTSRQIMARSLFVVLPLRDPLRPVGVVSIVEAMALGKSVVATKTAGTIDYLRDCETGLFVRPRDHTDLIQKISSLLRDRQEIARLGRNARLIAISSFDEKIFVRRLTKIIKESLSTK